MNFPISRLFSNLLFLLLCTLSSGLAYADLSEINRIFHSKPSLNQFEICQGGGCAEASHTQLTADEWQQVSALFTPAPESAEAERKQISLAIGLLEEIVGKKIGTSGDRAGTFDNMAFKGQQDCNDEAINSTTYMRLLQQGGYIKFHEIEDTRTRNFFLTGWPHSTAVIHDVASGVRYAVDSWFYDNGHPATIVPFDQWKANYIPADSPIGKPRSKSPEETKR